MSDSERIARKKAVLKEARLRKQSTKLQPMMVRPNAAVRAFLEQEVTDGNASTMADALNRSVESAIRDRDEVRRELVTAFGGRDALVIGLLVARTVEAFAKQKGPARGSPEAWATCCAMIDATLASIAPAPASGFEVPRPKDEISSAELFATWSRAVTEGWRFEAAAGREPLLPVSQITATLQEWREQNEPARGAWRNQEVKAERIEMPNREVSTERSKK